MVSRKSRPLLQERKQYEGKAGFQSAANAGATSARKSELSKSAEFMSLYWRLETRGMETKADRRFITQTH